MNLEQLVPLLGKSERDEAVKAMLDFFGTQKTLPRPKRGEEDVYVELPEHKMEFVFTLAESCKTYKPDYLEGELIFHTLFFWPNEEDIARNIPLPLGVEIQANPDEQIKRLGSPEDGNPRLYLFRWGFDGLKLFLTYRKDEKTLRQVTYAFDDGCV
ncbi:MAG: hypothetical protein LBS89_09085 [Zoogloeaceae bacterium]|nr:hypothetical protein [Zoogloeaceae bacterium]